MYLIQFAQKIRKLPTFFSREQYNSFLLKLFKYSGSHALTQLSDSLHSDNGITCFEVDGRVLVTVRFLSFPPL